MGTQLETIQGKQGPSWFGESLENYRRVKNDPSPLYVKLQTPGYFGELVKAHKYLFLEYHLENWFAEKLKI